MRPSSMRRRRPRMPTRRAIPRCIRPRRATNGIWMKAHFGVDSGTKLIYTMAATPANLADNTVLPKLLHGQETRVWGDQAYRGQRAVIRERAPKARDFTNRRYRHRGVVDEIERAKNRTKSKVGPGRTRDR